MNRPARVQSDRNRRSLPTFGIYVLEILRRFIVEISRRCTTVQASNASKVMENARKQSSEWVARLNADDVSEEDREAFEQWRSSDPSHAVAYEEITSTWLVFTSLRIS